jgi:hypothetical protein
VLNILKIDTKTATSPFEVGGTLIWLVNSNLVYSRDKHFDFRVHNNLFKILYVTWINIVNINYNYLYLFTCFTFICIRCYWHHVTFLAGHSKMATLRKTMNRTMTAVTDVLFPVSRNAQDPQAHQILKAGNLRDMILPTDVLSSQYLLHKTATFVVDSATCMHTLVKL